MWALGCVLYESLTGRRPFKGIDTLRHAEYDPHGPARLAGLAPRTPKPLRELLRRCLETDRVNACARRRTQRQTLRTAAQSPAGLAAAVKTSGCVADGRCDLGGVCVAGRSVVAFVVDQNALPEKQLVVLPFKGFADDQAGAGFAEELRRNLLSLATDVRAAQPSELQQANFLNLDLQSATQTRRQFDCGGDATRTIRFASDFGCATGFYTKLQGELIGPRQSLAELQYRIAEQLTQDLKLAKSARRAFQRTFETEPRRRSRTIPDRHRRIAKDLNRDSVESQSRF